MLVLRIALCHADDRVCDFLTVEIGFLTLFLGQRAAFAGAREEPAGLEEVLTGLGGGCSVRVVNEDFFAGGDGFEGDDFAIL